MKFWAWLALKLGAALAAVAGLWMLVAWALTPVLPRGPHAWMSDWPALSWVLTFVAVVLVSTLGWFAAADQVYRCRVCARRLRLPRSAGDFSRAALHAPETEYICVYGHGKLTDPDVHMPSVASRHWVAYPDLWQSLIAADRPPRH